MNKIESLYAEIKAKQIENSRFKSETVEIDKTLEHEIAFKPILKGI